MVVAPSLAEASGVAASVHDESRPIRTACKRSAGTTNLESSDDDKDYPDSARSVKRRIKKVMKTHTAVIVVV